MIKTFSNILGVITLIVVGLYGSLYLLFLFYSHWGLFWTIVLFFIFPVMDFIGPFYALFVWGDWTPLIVIYGGGLVAGLLLLIGNKDR